MTISTNRNEVTSKIYIKDSNMVARKVAGEMVLVPIRQSTGDVVNIYTMNTVGARIWELLDGQTTIAQIRETIVNEYEVEPEVAEPDILEFLAELEKMGAASVA